MTHVLKLPMKAIVLQDILGTRTSKDPPWKKVLICGGSGVFFKSTTYRRGHYSRKGLSHPQRSLSRSSGDKQWTGESEITRSKKSEMGRKTEMTWKGVGEGGGERRSFFHEEASVEEKGYVNEEIFLVCKWKTRASELLSLVILKSTQRTYKVDINGRVHLNFHRFNSSLLWFIAS